MTVIAYRDGVLAADKRSNDGYLARTSTKIFRAPCGALLAGAGNSSGWRELRDWWIAGADATKWPSRGLDVTLLVVENSGRVLLYDDAPVPLEVEDDFIALGSGSDFATMAMHLGKSAREAVEATCLFCTSCGNGIDVLELEQASNPIAALQRLLLEETGMGGRQ